MISLININLKRDGAAILDKVYVKAEKMTRDKKKKGNSTMIKGSLYQEDIILNIYKPNNRASKYMIQTLM